jgi:uncharacterized membrane protein YtjA (UPF0391 family)
MGRCPGVIYAEGSNNRSAKEPNMLYYAVVFFVIALIAAVFGFSGLAAGAAGIAQILFVVFLVLAVGGFLINALRGPR